MVEIKMNKNIPQERKALKYIIKDSIIVYLSSVVALYAKTYIMSFMGINTSAVGISNKQVVFTDEPKF